MLELTAEQKQGIADALEGTSGMYDGSVCEAHGLEIYELEEIAAEFGVVRCEVCGWWISEDETVTDEDTDENACADCARGD